MRTLCALLALAAAGRGAAQCPHVELTPANHGPGTWFGGAIVAQADTAIASSAAGLHAFEREPQGWAEKQVIPDIGQGVVTDFALEGDTLLVGYGYGGLAYRGRVAVFERAAGVWQQTELLVPSQDQSWANFGRELDLQGDLAVFGSSGWRPGGQGHCFGAAYLFVRTPSGWQELQHLTPSDEQDYRFFGSSVALDGERLAIGAPGDAARGGAVYVFERRAGGWLEAGIVHASDTDPGDQFGISVDLSASTLLAGAPTHGPLYSGAAYVHVLTPTGWSEAQKLEPDTPWRQLDFGRKVQLDGSRLFVGNAPELAARAHKGVDGYRRTAQGWVQSGRFVHPASTDHSYLLPWTYGAGAVWIGDSPDSGAGTNSGSVLGFETCDWWTPCTSRPSSTGAVAELAVWSGTPSVAANDLVLFASPIPNEPGTLLFSPNLAGVRFANGVLCLGAPLLRYPATQGAGGAFVQPLDLMALPGTGAVQPGDTWHFQLWFRDAAGGSAGSNLSNALAIVFRP